MSSYQIGDYRQTYANFRLTRPKRYNWAFDVFDRWAADPDKVAMRWVSDAGRVREVTFREFSRTSTRFANALAGLGVKPGERFFVMLPRVVEWWEVLLGGIRARAVSVPGTTLLRHKDIVYRINASGATVAVTDSDNADRIEAVREECPGLRHVIVVGGGPQAASATGTCWAKSSASMDHPRNLSTDALMIYFTSGTTGPPKMVVNDHASYPKAARHHRQVLAGQPPHGPPLDAFGHGMGPGRLDLPVRPLEHGRGDLHLGPPGAVRCPADPPHAP